jgi:hypothetical protein
VVVHDDTGGLLGVPLPGNVPGYTFEDVHESPSSVRSNVAAGAEPVPRHRSTISIPANSM